MELLLSLGVGLMFGCGVWLVLRRRTFSAVLGLTLLAYAVNLLIFLGGRIDRRTAPLTLPGAGQLADPLPQALVLTAIVIGFGMTAYLVALSLKSLGAAGTDRVDLPPEPNPCDETQTDEPRDRR